MSASSLFWPRSLGVPAEVCYKAQKQRSKFSTSKSERGVDGVERSKPPVVGISGGSLRSTPATPSLGTANLEVLKLVGPGNREGVRSDADSF